MVDILLQKIKENCTNVDLDIVNKAFNLAYEAHKEQKRESGDPYIIHPIDVAVILAELGMDTSTIVAGLLHDVIEDTDYTYDDIKNIASEAREKLKTVEPETLAQASRISGVNPADIAIIMVYLKKGERKND